MLRKNSHLSSNFAEVYAKQLFSGFSILAIFFLLPYGFLQYSASQYLLSGVYFGSAIFIGMLWILSRNDKYTLICTKLFAGIGIIVLLPWQITGGVNDSGLFWFMAYIIFVYTFLDKLTAAFWLTILYGGSIILTVLGSLGIVESAFSGGYLLHFYYASLLAILLMVLYTYLRDRLKQTLQNTSKALEEAQSLSDIGSWRWDVKNDHVTWSTQLHRLFGVEKGKEITFETYLKAIYKEDRETVEINVEQALSTRKPYEFKHRVKHNDGTIVWVLGRGKVIEDEDGNVVAISGTAQDITSQMEIETKLLRQNEQLRKLEKMTVDRELKMISLKREIKELKDKKK